jgi:cell division transport system permease protein
MIALLRYSIGEASLSLARGWRASLLAIAIITAAVFIAGAVLLVSINVDRILERLAATAELTIYLKPGEGEGDERRAAVAAVLSADPSVSSSNYVGADAALERFRRELPELAALVGTLEENPLPAAFDVRLRDGVTDAATRSLVQSLQATGAVEDVRYDRRIFDRLSDGLRILRQGGFLLAAVIVLAAIVTITSVLRLAYLTRRDETAVLFLLGMPPSAIRGPFVVEGMLQTLAGALAAVLLLWAAFGAVNAQIGPEIGQAFGTGAAVFLPRGMVVILVVASVLVGALAGLVAAWKEP